MKKILLIFILLLAAFLRLYHLDTNPPSLYWDEASLGYNAYSILNSGRDEHGELFPLARFMAFGDYKPPGYIYAAVPFISFLGLNETSVRLPSALAGILMVYFTFILTYELFIRSKPALIASFLLAVSPWSLHLSRAAFEANLAALFSLSGIYFFFRSRSKGPLIILSFFFFLLSFHTFNANRIIAPLLIFVLSFIFYRTVLSNLKWFLISGALSFIFLIPSLGFLTSPESRIRLQEVSIFNNLTPLIESNSRISLDSNTVISKLLHNRRIVYALDYLSHFTDNFKLRYLFTRGDVNARLALPDTGQLLVINLPFLILGLYYLLSKLDRKSSLIFSWLVIAVIPAGLAKETPHALRTVSILPAYQIIIAWGWYRLLIWLKKKYPVRIITAILTLIAFFLSVNLSFYLHQYHIHFPRNWSGEWQYGTREMAEFVSARENFYDRIYISPLIGRPYIFIAFYKPFEPVDFNSARQAHKDIQGFWEVTGLGKYRFNLDNMPVSGKILAVKKDADLPRGFKLIKIIHNLSGEPVFYISDSL